MNIYTITIALLLSCSLSNAAPIPGASGTAALVPDLGIHTCRFGFEIETKTSNWLKAQPPKKSKFIETVYRSPELKNETRGTLTVRVDKMKNQTNLKSYVGRWVKEYPKYGYDVLGSRRFKSKGKRGYVIDLIHSKKQRQLRQVIYLKEKTAVLMTCRDHVKSFKGSIKSCNKIVKGFRWTL